MEFSKIVFDDSVDTDIARVNRATGVLYLNPGIWNRLSEDEREFVLLHENGHLELQTASEYQANRYAVGKYIPVKTLSNSELGKRIQVVSEITNPDKYISHYGVDPVSNVAGALGDIFKALPLIGVGKKGRIQEQNAAAENQLKLTDKLAANKQTLLITGGLFLIVGIVLFFTFKK